MIQRLRWSAVTAAIAATVIASSIGIAAIPLTPPIGPSAATGVPIDRPVSPVDPSIHAAGGPPGHGPLRGGADVGWWGVTNSQGERGLLGPGTILAQVGGVETTTSVTEFDDGDGNPEPSENTSIPPPEDPPKFGDVQNFGNLGTDDGATATLVEVKEKGDHLLSVGFAARNIPAGSSQTVELEYSTGGTAESFTLTVVRADGTSFASETHSLPPEGSATKLNITLGSAATDYVNTTGSLYVVIDDTARASDKDLTSLSMDYLRVRTVTADVTPPTLANVTLADATDGDGNVTGGDTISVAADVIDTGSGVASVTTDASAFGAGTVTLTDGDTDGTYDATFPVDGGPPTTDGSFQLTVTATDNEGNTDSATTGGRLTLDTTDPIVTDPSVTDLEDGNRVVGDTHNLRVAAAVSDATLATVTADASGFGVGTVSLADADGDGVYDATLAVDGANASQGAQAVTITATDGVGLSTQNTTGALTVDTLVPTFTDASLVDDENGDGTVNDGDTVLVSAEVDGTGSNVTLATDASAFGGPATLELSDTDGDGVFNATFAVNTSTTTDGTYQLTVTATDEAANTASAATNALTLDSSAPDTSPPTVTNATLTDTTDGNDVVGDGHELTVAADVEDNRNVGNVTADASAFGAGGVTLTPAGGSTFNATFTVDAANASADGDHGLNVTADDGAGNVGWMVTGSLTLDTTEPDITTVAVSDADGNGIVGNNDDVTITATVDDATSVTVTANASALGDGTVPLAPAGGSTYTGTATVDATNTTAQGAVTIPVDAVDAAGNDATNASADITLDTTDPTLTNATITDSDGDGSVGHGDRVDVSVDATDATALTVSADASAFGAGTVTLSASGGSTYSGSFAVDAPASAGAGDHAVTLTAVDAAGNDVDATTGTLELVIPVDTADPSVTAPSVVDATDGNGVVADTHDLRVAATVTDDVAVSSVTADAAAFGAGTITLAATSGDRYAGTASVDDAAAGADGSHAVTVTATDTAGNATTRTTGNLTLDTTAPAVTGASLVDATNGDGSVGNGDRLRVSTAVTDATVVTVAVDASAFGAGSVSLADPDADGVFAGTFTVVTAAAAADGDHALAVTATDAGTNVGAATTNSITLARASPPPAGRSGGGGGGGGARPSSTVVAPPGLGGSLSVRVTGVAPGRPVRVLPNPAARDGGDVRLDELVFTTLDRRTVELTARVTRDPPTSASSLPDASGRRAIAYLTIDHPATPPDRVGPSSLRFSLDRSVLEGDGLDPGQVALYRQSGGDWAELPTRFEGFVDGRAVFVADSPGLSVFAIGAKRPVLSVADASLDRTRLDAGGAVEVLVRVANDGEYRGTYAGTLLVAGRVAATAKATVPAGESRSVTLRYAFDAPGEFDLALDGRPLGTVVVEAATAGPGPAPGPSTPAVRATPGDEPDRASPGQTGGDGGMTPATLAWLDKATLVLVLYVLATAAVVLGLRRRDRRNR